MRFVEELPGHGNHRGGKPDPRYDELAANPGRWAEWWGPKPNYVHKCVRSVKRPGVTFEATVRDGKAFIRAVRDA